MNASRLGKSVAVLAILLGILSFAPSAVRVRAEERQKQISLVTDWSHKHMIYSRPSAGGLPLSLASEPRFWQQDIRRQQRILRDSQAGTPGAWSVNLGPTATVGALNSPAKFSFDSTTANCSSDYVAFNTSVHGSSSQASIMAFNNLYSGCGGTTPSVYWAYNTSDSFLSTTGTISTSVVVSLDGSQLAFIDTPTSGSASLVILKWVKGQGTAYNTPVAPNHVFASASYLAFLADEYSLCRKMAGVSCMLGWHISGGFNDATSSPFYDYTSDVLYLGDAHGRLHKFTGIFNGIPAEVTTHWPVVLQSAVDQVASPVYDSISGRVFAADADGFLYSVTCTQSSATVPCSTSTAPTPTTAVTQSVQLAASPGVVDGPIVDGSSGEVFVFVEKDLTGSMGVDELPVGFTSSTTPTFSTLQAGYTGPPVYAGDFDQNYFSSEPGSSGQSPAGNLWVCANSFLYSVPVTAGMISTTPQFTFQTAFTSSGSACSSVTEFFNPNLAVGPEDSIFFSVGTNSAQNYSGLSGSSDCGGAGCMMSLTVSTWQPNTAYAMNQHILDSNGHEEVVIAAGTSGSTQPTWPNMAIGFTADGSGSLMWLDQGDAGVQVSGTSEIEGVSSWCSNAWSAGSCGGGGQSYSAGDTVLDNLGFIQYNVASCTSGTSLPSWDDSFLGAATADGSCEWISLGPAGMATLAVASGTSGITIDNSVPASTLAGASQVYFSTLGSQTCGIMGTGGCATQASQPDLR